MSNSKKIFDKLKNLGVEEQPKPVAKSEIKSNPKLSDVYKFIYEETFKKLPEKQQKLVLNKNSPQNDLFIKFVINVAEKSFDSNDNNTVKNIEVANPKPI